MECFTALLFVHPLSSHLSLLAYPRATLPNFICSMSFLAESIYVFSRLFHILFPCLFHAILSIGFVLLHASSSLGAILSRDAFDRGLRYETSSGCGGDGRSTLRFSPKVGKLALGRAGRSYDTRQNLSNDRPAPPQGRFQYLRPKSMGW